MVGVFYIIGGKLGFLLAQGHPSATAVWPPTGIAIATLILLGYEIWPAILVGDLIVSMTTAGTFLTSLAIAGGNTVEGLVAAYLVNRFAGGPTPFDRPRNAFRFVALAAVLGPAIGASLCVTTLSVEGFAHWPEVWALWMTRWLAGAGGATVVAPVILLAVSEHQARREAGRSLEGFFLVVTFWAVTAVVFLGLVGRPLAQTLEFLYVPLLAWAAFRFDQRFPTLLVLFVSAAAVWGTYHGLGPFVGHDRARAFITLMLFMAVASVTSLFLTAVIAARNRAERELHEQRRFLRQVIDINPNFIFAKDRLGRFTLVNQAVAQAYGTSVENLIGKTDADFNPNEDEVKSFRKMDLRVMDTKTEALIPEEKITDSQGHVRWLQTVKRPLENEGGTVDQILGVATDITERRETERRQAALYQIATITTQAVDLDAFYAAIHRIIGDLMYARNFYIALADEEAGEIQFPYFVDEIDTAPAPLKTGQGLTGHIISTGRPLLLTRSEITDMHAKGLAVARGADPVQWLGVPLQSGERTFGVLAVQSYTDGIQYGERERDLLVFVSQHIAAAIEKKSAEKEIERLAFQDPLTGLANRSRFDDRLGVALATARRERHRLAVLFMDLDRFKVINDSLGHKAGDLLLRKVAERLAEVIRETDALARVGGDEFILVLSKISRPEGASVVARKIQDRLRQPLLLGDREIFTTLSTGISIFPEDGEDADTLIRHADEAMYAAKQQGRDSFRFASYASHQAGPDRLELEMRLHRALERSEIKVYFQPIVRLVDSEITGMEALVRWEHPVRGLLYPSDFIPVAEDSGLIYDLGSFVFREACRQALSWRKVWRRDLTVAVNVSVRQLQEPGFVATVRRVIDETGLPPQALNIEITESFAMRSLSAGRTILGDLHALGIGITMDDFGTGYSSLSYLKILPIDALKIDYSFIRDVATDSDDAAIVRASIVMGHELGLRVIAEGVETPDQLRFLREHNCDELQGFLFSPALGSLEFAALLEAKKHLPR